MTTADKGITSRFLSSLAGAVRRTLQAKCEDFVDIKDFGAKCDGLTPDDTAWAAAIAAASSATQGGCLKIRFKGKSRITTPIVLTKEFVIIEGDGQYSSQILFSGVTDSAIKVTGPTYLRPCFRNFSIIGDASSGIGLNFSGVTSQVYLGSIENLTIYSGGTCVYAPGAAGSPKFFSNVMRQIAGYSYSGHGFHIWSGPGNTFQSLYALSVPAGKAGFRMAGTVTLTNCNGLNSGDVWGAFGSETAGTDGFQGDFSGTDYVDLTMIGCNVERFGSITAGAGIGIRICNIYRNVNIIGGTLQRADVDIPLGVGSYKALISTKYGSNQPGNPIRLAFGSIFLRDVINGTGTNTPSQAHLYAEFGTGQFEDANGVFNATSILTYRVNADALSYPVPRIPMVNDQFSGFAHGPIALSPRRISLQMVRYNLGAVLTPVGAGQAIDVTGRAKVIVTPAAGSTISTATFTATVSDATTDYARNGELVIEAGNANLTIVHTAAGANVFVNKSGGNYVMAAGEIRKYMRSETNGNWREIG